MDNLLYWVWLSEQTPPGNSDIRELLLKVENPEIIYFMDEAELRDTNMLSDYSIHRLMNKDIEGCKKIIEKCSNNNYNIICYADIFYPDRLRNLDLFPIVLYHRGIKFMFDDLLSIAVVGTRHPSLYGIDVAKKLSRELAHNGALVISGMAYGIDASAHQGAMSIDKPTVAVLGSGIDVITPLSNKYLYDYMVSNGAIYSEYPPGTKGWPQNYPLRNRIISALSVGVLVVEAEEKSGALITANCALDQGKDVFAVPNVIDNVKGRGPHKLIRDGAILVTSGEDILSEYTGKYIHQEEIKTFSEKQYNEEFLAEDFIMKFDDLTPLEKEIALFIGTREVISNEITESLKVPADYVLSSLTMLEIKGVVKSLPGQIYILNIN